MDLIIVESPTKARTLGGFLDKSKYLVEATMGHIRDLPEKELGVEVDNDFKPVYRLMVEKKEVTDRLKKEVGKVEAVYIATDPDREGEAIAFHVFEILKETKKPRKKVKPFHRITFHEITETAIRHALENPGEINMNLVAAQEARRILDRLVGYKLSPLLWRKVRKGLSAGRVQSVAVRLIVEKEREILAFIPVEYWDIKVWLAKDQTPPNFWVKLSKIDGKRAIVGNGETAKRFVADLTSGQFVVNRVDTKDTFRSPVPPFTTSMLQQTAANKLGWSAKRTMQVAQRLYEEGYITYHRTDSVNIATEALDVVRKYILTMYGKQYLPEKPRLYKTKSKVAQEAHEAIRPTNLEARSQKLEARSDEGRLYDLIWKRFVASQMCDLVLSVTGVEVSAGTKGNIGLEVRGETEKFAGWRVVYQGVADKIQDDKMTMTSHEVTGERLREMGQDEESESESRSGAEAENSSNELPMLKVGDVLQSKEVKSEQKFTSPPARFSEASLIKILEDLGIGRPSTYAPTISTILDRNYVEKQERYFIPTSLGYAVCDFLTTNFKEVMEYGFTADMEDNLDAIANGDKERVPVLTAFYEPFAKKVASAGELAERVAVKFETTGDKCPKCSEGDQVIRVGRFGKFLSCNRFPECDWRAPLIIKIENVVCPKCGSEIVYKRTKKGKGFYGCSTWPKCDFASWRKPIAEVGVEKVAG